MARLLVAYRARGRLGCRRHADVGVAMAVTERAQGHHGISAFIIPKGTPGFRLGRKENKLGLRASDTGEVIFTDCRLPSSQLLGKAGEGFIDSLKILTAAACRSPRWASAWRRAPTKRLCATRSSGGNSAGRSPSFKPCRTNSPTWPRKSMRRAC